MSIALSRRTPVRSMKWAVPWVGMGVCLVLLMGHLVFDLLTRRRSVQAVEQRSSQVVQVHPQPASTTPAHTIVLPGLKLEAAKISPEPARYDQLPVEMGVAGRIEVNADHRIVIRPRAVGVVREVFAQLGQKVKRGDRLVTLDSPDIGTARLNIRAKQRDLYAARIEAEWKSQVAATVALLIPEIQRGTDPATIEKEFADKQLGAYRGSLLQAYADYDIATHEEEKTAYFLKNEVMGEHPALLAKHTRQGLQAKLYATIEQVKFDAAQAKRLVDINVQRAESDVIDAAHRLRILGVSEDIRELLEHADRANQVSVDEDVTLYQINAPFDGTVITKDVVVSQKAEPNDILFTVADLNTVWVTANIPESDLAKLPRIEGGAIRLTSAAYGSRIFPAKLLSVGAMVDPQTRTVPLLAQSDNHQGLLKPGLFVRILLDSPTTDKALTVPHSAVIEMEGKSGVFVPAKHGEGKEKDQLAFTFIPLELGREFGDRVVVKSGLKEGDIVIAGGANQLKAELVLRNEPEED
ncbi:MAG: efflux RND transporter periplasmic adaptor subunit [Isosphaeraceae bacterium]